MAKKKSKKYVVKMEDGSIKVFNDWSETENVVKGTPLQFASGETLELALNKLNAIPGKLKKKSSAESKSKKKRILPGEQDYPKEGICSDAGTHGNPGPSEYQVTDLNGTLLLHRELGRHSNNYAELAGIGAMVKYAIQSKETDILWTDSTIALGWINTQRIGQTVHERAIIVKMARIIKNLLDEHPNLQLKKWNTRKWGQIPADFGRK